MSAGSWVLAARPKTLWAAVAPVIVGSALAVRDDVFRFDAFAVTMLAALAIQVGVNFANDVADADKGADTAERIGPKRAVASGLITPKGMWRGIGVTFGFAAICGLYLIWLGGWVILIIGVVSIVAAFGYTNGPVPYGYRGLGELFVFVFFGVVATVGTRFVFDRTAPLEAWVLAVPVGLLATAILVANNVRDLDTDAVAGKNTLAVRLGSTKARWLYVATVGGSFLVVGVGAIMGWTPRGTAAALVTMPLAVPLVRSVRTASDGSTLIRVLQGTARLQLAFAVVVSAGAVLT